MVECAHGSTVGMPHCDCVISRSKSICVHVGLERYCMVPLLVFIGQEK